MTSKQIYSQDFIQQCFDAWYLSGRPSGLQTIRKVLPANPYNNKVPSASVINRWMMYGAWDSRADELDVKVSEKNDKLLINKKAAMLRKHQENAAKIAKKAHAHILLEEFDSSASAVQAYFRATEEERKTAGFSDLLEKLDKMTNNEVEREIIALLNRGADNDQIIDSNVEDVSGEEDKEESPA